MLFERHRKLAIVCAIILALFGFIYGTVFLLCKIYLNTHNIKQIIATQAEKKLKRAVTFDDDIELNVDFDMSPHLIVHNLAIANSPWATAPHILTVEKFEIHINLLDLLFKTITVDSLRLIKPTLNLESSSKRSNWDDLQKDIDSDGESSFRTSIKKVTILKGLWIFNADKYSLDKLEFTMHDDNTKFHVHLQGTHDGLPIKATLDIEKKITYFKLDITNLQIGKSDIHGNLNIEYDPARITGEFDSDKLIIKDFTTTDANSNGEYSIPDAPWPVKWMHGAEFNITAKIDMVDLNGIRFEQVTLKAKNANNVITLALNPPAKVDAGTLDFKITYDLNHTKPQFTLNAKTSTIQLATILEQMFGKASITGSTLDFSTALTGHGDNLNAIVGSMNGKILLVAGPGHFMNSTATLGSVFTNVLSSVITFEKSAPSTEFKCGVMNFKVSNGVANAKQGIGIEAASVNVLGNGMIDLRNGKIAFSIVPQTTLSVNPMDIANFSVAQLVEVNGTLSKPVMTLNTSNLLQQSAGAIISAGIIGASGGLGTIFAGSGAAGLFGQGKQVVSPCKTALGE